MVIDPLLVATMDEREYRAGLAEVLKYGVIRDPAFFAWQEAHADALVARDPAAVAHAVAESCRIKADYVAADPFERGIRAQLSYGRTFGHALEAQTGFSERLLHGEAVALGMVLAARFSAARGMLPGAESDRVAQVLAAAGLPTELSALGLDDPTVSDDRVFEAMARHPELIERPVFVHGGRAVVGRPPERVLELLRDA